MVKKRIHVKITSQDNNQAYTVEAEYRKDRYIFIDPEGNKNYVVFKNDSIEYYKKGTMDMKYIFDLSRPHKGTYKLDGYLFEFMVHTTSITSTEQYLEVAFELFQGHEKVNQINLHISIDVI